MKCLCVETSKRFFRNVTFLLKCRLFLSKRACRNIACFCRNVEYFCGNVETCMFLGQKNKDLAYLLGAFDNKVSLQRPMKLQGCDKSTTKPVKGQIRIKKQTICVSLSPCIVLGPLYRSSKYKQHPGQVERGEGGGAQQASI